MKIKKGILKKIIGRKDKGCFPELSLENIELKVDTGAYTSTIHCTLLETFSKNAEEYVNFIPLDQHHPGYKGKEITLKKHKEKSVKSSNGESQSRFVVETTIELFGTVYPIQLTLSNRSDMRFPVLLGRRFLTDKFIVDTSEKNLSFKHK